jgi:hypothetical protein
MRIKIYRSPFHSPIEVAGDIVLKLHFPYSATTTTIQVNPNIQDYKAEGDASGGRLRQVMFSVATDETRTLPFDLNGTRKQRTQIGGTTYKIELIGIADEALVQGGNAKRFDFEVTKL